MGTMGTTGDLNGVEMCPGLALRPLNGKYEYDFEFDSISRDPSAHAFEVVKEGI